MNHKLVKTAKKKVVEFLIKGKRFAQMSDGWYGSPKVYVDVGALHRSASRCLTYEDVEAYQEVFSHISHISHIKVFQEHTGLSAAKCKFLLDEWTDAVLALS